MQGHGILFDQKKNRRAVPHGGRVGARGAAGGRGGDGAGRLEAVGGGGVKRMALTFKISVYEKFNS